jgi:DNA mismatch repair ATPase MutS
MEAEQFFHNQVTKNNTLYKKLQKSASQIAGLRVVIFIIATALFVYFINQRELGIALGVLFSFLILFIFLIKRHNHLKFQRDQYKFLAEINVEELARQEGDLSSIENGADFFIKDHTYAEDLDILGNHSVYQLLNRTTTYPGKKLLAKRLLGEKSSVGLTEKQVSVIELMGIPMFMQEYQALGRHVKADKEDFLNFNSWLINKPNLINKKGIKFWSYFLPAVFLIVFAIASIFSITYYTMLPIVLVNLILLGKQHKYALEVVDNTAKSLKMLRSFVNHIDLVEQQNFSKGLLSELASEFNREGHRAKIEIGKITSLLEHLQTRNNIFHLFVNIPALMDIHWLIRIENWQERNRDNIHHWFDALAEFELLISLAGHAFANREWVMPEINETPYFLKSKNLGHPLIAKDKRINNDFEMEEKGKVILLTGPNMAGKSTFLRTIGVNIILAQIGSTVCASEFSFNEEMKVFTAMRIKDNLSESISSFYAELSRIKQLLELVEKDVPVLYFLDEILKGTNSADRHKGAEALIKQLSKLKVSGFVSTHDLELGEMAKKMNTVNNYSFESIIDNGNINFDYRIREGICQSFNASELMRQMGIDV